MKLELKHLAPYLPYNIQGVDKVGNYYYLYSVDNIMSSFDLWMNGNFHKFNGSDGIKPILRPLSDLTKEIEHNGERFVPISNIYIKNSVEWLTDFPEQKENVIPFVNYIDFENLVSWHFDVFGLIEQGLAIDINTLKK